MLGNICLIIQYKMFYVFILLCRPCNILIIINALLAKNHYVFIFKYLCHVVSIHCVFYIAIPMTCYGITYVSLVSCVVEKVIMIIIYSY